MYLAMGLINAFLNILLFVLILVGFVHALIQPANAFTAFASRSKTFWLVLLGLGALFTFGAAARSVLTLLTLLLGPLPLYLHGLYAFAGRMPFGNFFGILLFVLPSVYFAGDYKKVNRFRQYQRGQGKFQQRPGNPYGDSRGPRDW